MKNQNVSRAKLNRLTPAEIDAAFCGTSPACKNPLSDGEFESLLKYARDASKASLRSFLSERLSQSKIIAEFNHAFGFDIPNDTSLHALENYSRIMGRIELADRIKNLTKQNETQDH